MRVAYDEYYLTENLFGKPYPELIDFFSKHQTRGSLLDLGCGQGRDAIPLARLGYDVMGVDNSVVGVDQMNQIALREKLPLKGIVANIYEFNNIADFDFLLLDSMFHFEKKDLKRETDFIQRIIQDVKKEALITFCIQDTGKKVSVLNDIIDINPSIQKTTQKEFQYVFEDSVSSHKSTTNYQMIVLRKQ